MISGTAEELSFFEDGCPTNPLIDAAAPPTRVGEPVHGGWRVGLSSAEARRMSASVGSIVMTVTEVLADLSGVRYNNSGITLVSR